MTHNSAKRSELQRRRKRVRLAVAEANISGGLVQVLAVPWVDTMPHHYPALEIARELLQTHGKKEIELSVDELGHIEGLVAGRLDPSCLTSGRFIFRPTEALQIDSLATRLCFVMQSAMFQLSERPTVVTR